MRLFLSTFISRNRHPQIGGVSLGVGGGPRRVHAGRAGAGPHLRLGQGAHDALHRLAPHRGLPAGAAAQAASRLQSLL